MEYRWPRELVRTGWAVLWFGLCAWLMSLAQIMGDERLIKQEKAAMGALPDLGLHLLPHPAGWPKWMADVTLNSFLFISLIAWGVACWAWGRGAGGEKNRQAAMVRWLVLVRRGFWLFGACYLLRMVSLLGTTLPSSNPHCVLKARHGWWEWISTGPLILIGKAQTCTDKLFSGHTCLATLLISFWLLRNVTQSPSHGRRLQSVLIRSYAMLHGCSVWLASLVCRHHYTVDIVLAIIVSSSLFHLYHLLVWIAQSAITHTHVGYSHILGLDRLPHHHKIDPEAPPHPSPPPPPPSDYVQMTERHIEEKEEEEEEDEGEVYEPRTEQLPRASVQHPLDSILWLITWLDGIDLRVASTR